MNEPRAVTFKEVEKVYPTPSEARDAWNKICNITGAGEVVANDHATIDITGSSASQISQVDKVLVAPTPVNDSTKKGGN